MISGDPDQNWGSDKGFLLTRGCGSGYSHPGGHGQSHETGGGGFFLRGGGLAYSLPGGAPRAPEARQFS